MRIVFVFCLSLILVYPFTQMTPSAQTQPPARDRLTHLPPQTRTHL